MLSSNMDDNVYLQSERSKKIMKHPKVKEFLKYTDTVANPYAYYL